MGGESPPKKLLPSRTRTHSPWKMGQKASLPFTEEELEDFEDCTFLSRKQIVRVYETFRKYDKGNGILSKEEFCEMPELKDNPFVQRIADVFSQDGTGDMAFEDYLDFMSIFSPQVGYPFDFFFL